MANERTAAFRQMLTKLAGMITRNDLDNLKFMCMDRLPRATIDDIGSTVDLWVALEERDHLSVDGIAFLETLLRDGCGGREDVIRVLQQYKLVTDGLDSSGQDLTDEFEVISKELGRQWRPLARKLGLREVDIDCICNDNSRNLREQIRQCLIRWQRQETHHATKEKLVAALKACQLNMLAHQVTNVQRDP